MKFPLAVIRKCSISNPPETYDYIYYEPNWADEEYCISHFDEIEQDTLTFFDDYMASNEGLKVNSPFSVPERETISGFYIIDIEKLKKYYPELFI